MTSSDWAAAQQRVAARRLAHQQASTTTSQATTASLFTRLPAPLREFLTPFTTRTSTAPAFRVGQVDAELLDEELISLFKQQVGDALKYHGPHLRDDYDAEIQLVLRAVLFKLTIRDHNASYGASLQNLRYVDARDVGKNGALRNTPPTWVQKTMYGLLSVGGRYAWHRWEERLLDMESVDEEPTSRMRWLKRVTGQLGTVYSVAALTNFLAFLINGQYRTLLDRLLRLRLIPATAHVSREVSFEYLNRQLVWHAFTEFLLFILPLVGISRWRRWVGRGWRKVILFWRRVRGVGGDAEEDEEVTGELGFLPERTCAICHKDQNPTGAEGQLAGGRGGVLGSAKTDVTNPYMAVPCGCIYCFVCLVQQIDAEDDEAWTCLRCGRPVKECAPWHGDLLLAEDSTRIKADDENEDGFTALEPLPLPDGREQQLERQIEGELAEEVGVTNGRSNNEVNDSAAHSPHYKKVESSWVQADGEQGLSDVEEELDEAQDPSASLIA